ncbi:MAG TPA: TonB-dependent receptor [Nevskiales bacterium]|nr:TonB-dependent receptor [Nevskiales bacterium]
MHHRFRLALVAVALALSAAPVSADHPVWLEGLEVTAEGEPSLTVATPAEARRQIEKTAGGVDLVEDREYRDGRVSTLQDALGYSPGVFVQPRFGAEEARLSIRGSGIQRTFHLRGIELLQDGVPLNQADGGSDFQAVEPLATRYIEVYRGANALSHGAATLGGSINFVTASGHDAPDWLARLEAGSFGYLRGQAATAGVDDRLDYTLSLSHFSQDGFREHAVQDTQRLFGNAGWRLREDLETRVYLAYVDTESELPGSLTKAQLQDDPRQANPANIAGDQKRDFTLWRLANKTRWRLNAAETLELSVFYADKDLFHPIFQVLEVDSEDYGVDVRFVSEAPLYRHGNRLVVGARALRGQNLDARFANVGGALGAPTNRLDQTATHLQLYAENQYAFVPGWTGIVGAHAVRAARDSRDELITGGVDESADETYRGFSPRLGLLYEPAAGTQLFANLSRSFEPPSFAELRRPDGRLNDAQRATTVEVGTRLLRPRYAFELAYYQTWVRDELLSLTDPPGAPPATLNADRTRHQGLELGFDWHVAAHWNLRSAYLWSDFRFDDDAQYGDNELAGIPPHLLRAELLYRAPAGWHAGPTLEWSPSDYYIDHRNSFEADGYTVWGLKLGRRSESGWGWFVEGRNLTDRRYAATTGVIEDAGGLDRAQFLPGDGRSFFAGLEWRS